MAVGFMHCPRLSTSELRYFSRACGHSLSSSSPDPHFVTYSERLRPKQGGALASIRGLKLPKIDIVGLRIPVLVWSLTPISATFSGPVAASLTTHPGERLAATGRRPGWAWDGRFGGDIGSGASRVLMGPVCLGADGGDSH